MLNQADQTIDASMNPLRHLSFPINWAAIHPESVESMVEDLLEHGNSTVSAIAQIPLDQCSFENTVVALDRITGEVSRGWGLVETLHSVDDNPPLRTAYAACLPKITDFFTALTLNADLYGRVRAVADRSNPDLNPTSRRLLAETLADFVDGGADLPPTDRETLRTLKRDLANKAQSFSDNVLDSTNAWEWLVVDPSELQGVPARVLETIRQDALQRGHGSESTPVWRVTLQAPTMGPILQHCDVRATREKVWRAAQTIGRTPDHDNLPLIRDILALREQKALLLGHSNFASSILHRRMAATPEAVDRFIDELYGRITDRYRSEIDALRNLKASQTNEPVADFQPWDVSFWAERMSAAELDFSGEQLRPWFPHTKVLPGLFGLSEKLFGIRIRECPPSSADIRPPATAITPFRDRWDDAVKLYAVDDLDGTLRGYFYADWFPRDTKRSGAWMSPMVHPDAESGLPAIGLIAGNLTPPAPGQPALLSHEDVQTIFHEFGHLLHHILSEVPYGSIAGTNVAWDFVELPSQILENWCWERESLDLFARHWENGAPIPEDLFQKMLRSRTFLAASACMRQLAFARLDLTLHTLPAPADTAAVEQTAIEAIRDYQIDYPEPVRPIHARFSHLFASPTGYASGYYSYKWAEVLEADAFSRFKDEGILNPSTGAAFRTAILARGNSVEPMRCFRDFLGREPDPEALLQRDGL